MGIATFAGMDVLMKSLSIEMGAYNAMLWRTSIALSIAAALFLGGEGVGPARESSGCMSGVEW
jgi:S-adenosylmethionine uptake transporter